MAWNKLNVFRDSFRIPEVSCVYAFYFDNELVYIGSTVNLKKRLNSYRFRISFGRIVTNWGRFDKDTKIEVKFKCSKKYGYWLMLEARLIKRLQPKFNIRLRNGTHNEMV